MTHDEQDGAQPAAQLEGLPETPIPELASLSGEAEPPLSPDETLSALPSQTSDAAQPETSEAPLLPNAEPMAQAFPSGEPASAEATELGPHLKALSSEIANLRMTFQREITDQNMHRSVVEKLHREMLDYKEDFLQRAMEPMFRRLISWADHFEEILAQENIMKDDLTFMYEELVDALDRYGVEQFTTDEPQFDPAMQKIVKVEATEEEFLNRVVIRRLSPGYRLGSRVVRPEPVIAYKYVRQAAPPLQAPTTENTPTTEAVQ